MSNAATLRCAPAIVFTHMLATDPRRDIAPDLARLDAR
jgi:hypothetical protein